MPSLHEEWLALSARALPADVTDDFPEVALADADLAGLANAVISYSGPQQREAIKRLLEYNEQLSPIANPEHRAFLSQWIKLARRVNPR